MFARLHLPGDCTSSPGHRTSSTLHLSVSTILECLHVCTYQAIVRAVLVIVRVVRYIWVFRLFFECPYLSSDRTSSPGHRTSSTLHLSVSTILGMSVPIWLFVRAVLVIVRVVRYIWVFRLFLECPYLSSDRTSSPGHRTSSTLHLSVLTILGMSVPIWLFGQAVLVIVRVVRYIWVFQLFLECPYQSGYLYEQSWSSYEQYVTFKCFHYSWNVCTYLVIERAVLVIIRAVRYI